jgi:GGDEF domain-containing protein
MTSCARLGGDEAGELLPAIAQELCRRLQDALALEARQPWLEGARPVESVAHMLRSPGGNRADDLIGVGVEDVDRFAGLDQLAGDAHRLAAEG